MKKIAILGATGSVGSQTVDVAEKLKDDFDVVCISANSNWERAIGIAERLKPLFIIMGDEQSAEKVRAGISYDAHVLSGFDQTIKVLSDSCIEYVVLATSGIQGISVFEYCMKNHIPVGLANKETVVCGGEMFRKLAEQTCTPVYPIDSEHSAIYQCLGCSFSAGQDVRNIILTASGGPFYGWTIDKLENVTPEMALRHPNWNMGKKITIDSATLANKGQEVIEVRYLFDVPTDKIKVVIQPQSIIHSMVEFVDGSIMAQLGPADMRIPIQLAMEENIRKDSGLLKGLDFAEIGTISFGKPDLESFRCLKLAFDALDGGMSLPAVYSIADDVAVDLFIDGRIGFNDIPDIIENAMLKHAYFECSSVGDIFELETLLKNEIASSF